MRFLIAFLGMPFSFLGFYLPLSAAAGSFISSSTSIVVAVVAVAAKALISGAEEAA